MLLLLLKEKGGKLGFGRRKKTSLMSWQRELGAEIRACDFAMRWWKWRGMKCSKAEEKQPALEEFHQGNRSCVTFPVRVNEFETTHEKTSRWLHSIKKTGRLSEPRRDLRRSCMPGSGESPALTRNAAHFLPEWCLLDLQSSEMSLPWMPFTESTFLSAPTHGVKL